MTVLWKTSRSTNQDFLDCSGFAVELMLKAIYLRQQNLGAWPGEMRGSRWHVIERLVEARRLAQDVSTRVALLRAFRRRPGDGQGLEKRGAVPECAR